MAEQPLATEASSDKPARREVRAIVELYHQLRTLLEHVREGFAKFDAAEMDEFDVDDLIQRWSRC